MKGRLARLLSTTMSFQTKILPVKADSIVFHKNDLLPQITDKQSEINLKIAADELTNTTNVVGFPTETVYGLGGSALNDESVRSIYRAKNRPSDNPLIVHVSSIDQLKRKILPANYEIPEAYHALIDQFWPGPLTILLPVDKSSPVSKLVTANQPTVAVRIPSHPIARALIAISDTPLAAPSANASTRPSPTLASHVYHDLQGKIPYIIDGGPCSVGVESTVIDGLCKPPMLLRPGGVSIEEIHQYGGNAWENTVVAKKTASALEPVRTPGMKYRHYSPTAKVVLFIDCGDGITAIRNYLTENKIDAKHTRIALFRAAQFVEAQVINPHITVERCLGRTGQEASRNVFRLLREADELNTELILVEGLDESNAGLAVMNRLSKAAIDTVSGVPPV